MRIFKSILIFLLCLLAVKAFPQSSFTDLQKSDLAYKNYAVNGGAENGKYGWSETGSGTLSVDTTTKNNGKASIKFISAAGGDYLATSLVACKSGPNCLYKFYYNTTATTWTARVYDNSGNFINEKALPSTSGFAPESVSFVFTSGTYQIRFYDSSTGNTINIDDLTLSVNDNIGSTNLEPKLYDISSYTSGTGSWSNVRATCLLKKNRDGGFHCDLYLSGSSSSTDSVTITITGATFKNVANFNQGMAGQNNGSSAYAKINPNTSTITLYSLAAGTSWSLTGLVELESIPTWATSDSSLTVVRAENVNAFSLREWSNVSNCIFSGTGGNYLNDSDCTTATNTYPTGANNADTNNYYGIVGRNLKANGVYKVTVYGTIGSRSSSVVDGILSINDGTINKPCISYHNNSGSNEQNQTTCIAYFSYPSFQSSKTFRAYATGSATITAETNSTNSLAGISIEEVFPTQSMPQIVNLVSTTLPSVTIYNSASFNADGTVAKENGDWINGNASKTTGDYVITINSGVFSATPICNAIASNGGDRYVSLSCTSSTSCEVFIRNAGTLSDSPFNFVCHSPK